MLELLGIINQAKINHQALIPSEFILAVDSASPLMLQDNLAIVAAEIPNSTTQRITAEHENFNYSGRINWQDPQAPAFAFPGTVVKFKFTGTSLKLELSEDNWNSGNYIDVYLDHNPQPITIELKPDNGQPIVYDIAEGLDNQVHHVVLVKRTDYVMGEFNFHGIIIDGQLLPADPDSPRKIEVYGDSISSGAVVEYEVPGVQDPPGNNDSMSNAYYSYAAILARKYDAELSLITQSGASLMNGFGYWHDGTGAESFYDKLKPLQDAPVWDFSNYNPDLVIIALGQNDSSTIEIGRDFSAQVWQDHYKQLLANLRAKYPNAYFVGMFPNMFHDRAWDTYLIEAIAQFRSEHSDDRVFALIHEQVTPGHPRISEQQQMADTLQEFINTTLSDHGFNWDLAD
ncbi:MAG: GDSL-type esterase/lipase family protein [Pleurocapsa sp.]